MLRQKGLHFVTRQFEAEVAIQVNCANNMNMHFVGLITYYGIYSDKWEHVLMHTRMNII